VVGSYAGMITIYNTNDWKPSKSQASDKPIIAIDWTLDDAYFCIEDQMKTSYLYKFADSTSKRIEKGEVDSAKLIWKMGAIYSHWHVMRALK
jgi:hypothetical protein